MHQDLRTALVALLSATVGAALMLLFAGGTAAPELATGSPDRAIDELRQRIDVLEQLATTTPAEGAAAEPAVTAPSVAAPAAATEEALRAQQLRDSQQRRTDRISARLHEAGWSDAEIDALDALREQAALQAEQLQYESMRKAMDENPETASVWRSRRTAMRDTLGEEKYEDYLVAVGRPAAVEVRNVLAGSAGAAAGLQEGDRIRRYGGERVYDDSDLMFALLDGEPGQPVTLEVERDGVIFHVTVPRGPLGTARPGRYGMDF